MKENDVAKLVLDVAFRVHSALGSGLLESVYETVMAYELAEAGLDVIRQVPIPIRYSGLTFDEGFRADLMVAGSVLVELKSVDALKPVHLKQVLSHVRLSDRRLGLLINFGAEHLRDGIRRVVNGLDD